MDKTAFRSLRYGNVIQHKDGEKFMVSLTTRAANGDCLAASLIPAIQESDAADFSVIATDYNQTVLHGETVQGE